MKKLFLIPILCFIGQQAYSQSCNAQFSCTQSYGVVYFTNLSTPVDSSATFQWSFGDGTTDIGFTTSHLYPTNGFYLACLSMETTSGCVDTYCDSVFVDSSYAGDSCMAYFTFSQYDSITFLFNNSSWDNSQASFFWDFGDGTTSTDQNPITHLYTQNAWYTICLTISTTSGCTDTYCNDIWVNNAACSVGFGVQIFGNTVQFYVNGNNSPSGLFFWYFDDGQISYDMNPIHTYSVPGPYYVAVSYLSSDSTCTALYGDTLFVAGDSCSALFFANQTGSVVQFSPFISDPGKNYLWDFGDGTTSNSIFPAHSYSFDGAYNVCLTVSDSLCFAFECQTLYYSIDTTVGYDTICIADFSVAAIDTLTSTVWLTDLSSGAMNYFWDFGDGSTSTVQYPSHTYAQNGLYQVCLTIYCDSLTSSDHCEWIGVADSLSGGDDLIRSGFVLNVKPQSVTGVAPVEVVERITVFPNPSSSQVAFSLPVSASGETTIEMRNILGQLVLQQTTIATAGALIKMDVESLGSGWYVLKVTSGEKSFTANILKQ